MDFTIWVSADSRGIVLASHPSNIFKAIDPTVLVDTNATGIWLTLQENCVARPKEYM